MRVSHYNNNTYTEEVQRINHAIERVLDEGHIEARLERVGKMIGLIVEALVVKGSFDRLDALEVLNDCSDLNFHEHPE